jgi:hypothetical protein
MTTSTEITSGLRNQIAALETRQIELAEWHTSTIDKVARPVQPHGRHSFDKLTQGWAVPRKPS